MRQRLFRWVTVCALPVTLACATDSGIPWPTGDTADDASVEGDAQQDDTSVLAPITAGWLSPESGTVVVQGEAVSFEAQVGAEGVAPEALQVSVKLTTGPIASAPAITTAPDGRVHSRRRTCPRAMWSWCSAWGTANVHLWRSSSPFA